MRPLNAFDRAKSLHQLEEFDWGEPTFDSHLVQQCHQLRRKPLAEFTAENLRIMIGQEIGLRYLVPLALEKLEADPFIEGDFYPGDLLAAVLRLEDRFWTAHAELASQAKAIVRRARPQLVEMDDIVRKAIEPLLENKNWHTNFQRP